MSKGPPSLEFGHYGSTFALPLSEIFSETVSTVGGSRLTQHRRAPISASISVWNRSTVPV